MNHVHLVVAHEAVTDRTAQKLQQIIVVAARIEDGHRLVVVAQLLPGPGLEQFLEGADTARQRQKGGTALGHHVLALVHGLDDVQFGATLVRPFALDQCLGDHAHHAATGLQRTIRHNAH